MARSVNDLIGTAVGAPINQAKITGRCHRSLVAGTKRDRLCCIEPSDATAAAALAVGGGDEATTCDAGATTTTADSVAQGGAGPCTRYCTTHHSGRANTNPRCCRSCRCRHRHHCAVVDLARSTTRSVATSMKSIKLVDLVYLSTS